MSFKETKESFKEEYLEEYLGNFKTTSLSAETQLEVFNKAFEAFREQAVKLYSEMITNTSKSIQAIEDIYPETITGEMGTVLELLTKSFDLLDNALKIFEDAMIKSDEYVQQFQFLLPDLFYFRNIGEGYGIIISTLLVAFSNRMGVPIEKNQLMVIRKIILNLKNEPLLDSNKAIEYCDEIEDSGFTLENISRNINAVIDEILP